MRAVQQSEIVGLAGAALGLSTDCSMEALLKPALRRGCYLLAPCSSADLLRFVGDPIGRSAEVRQALERALEELITYGDLLEMRRLEVDAWDAPPVVLRPAPPSFVLRSAHDAIILGVAGDDPTALPGDLAALVRSDGPVRSLHDPNAVDLAAQLRGFGLSELKETAWLRSPPTCSAADYVNEWRARLTGAPGCAPVIDGLEVLDPATSSSYYRSRWRVPTKADSGMFVARRPQAYGAKLWSIVDLSGGEPRRIIDLLPSNSFERGCDLAWRLQAAIDELRGAPQFIDVNEDGETGHLSFHGPLPAFAERRLALAGKKVSAPGSLFRFSLPTAMLQAEIASLKSTLWMQPSREGGRR